MRTITQETISLYKQYLTNEEKAPATIEKYSRDIISFANCYMNCEISKSTVLSYKAELLKRLTTSSVNSVLSSLNSFFDFIGRSELKVKMLKVQRQLFSCEEKNLTKAEYERLIKAAKDKNNQRLYLLMQCICSTGIRVSEDI